MDEVQGRSSPGWSWGRPLLRRASSDTGAPVAGRPELGCARRQR